MSRSRVLVACAGEVSGVAQVRCADGSVLDVVPVPVLDRAGSAYETTLRLARDGAPFADVGERCHGVLQALLARLDGTGLPQGTAERGVRRWAAGHGADPASLWSSLRPCLPRDAELLDLRARDPDDVAGRGELRAVLRQARTWDGRDWQTRTDVVLQAWGDDGTGVQAVLSVEELRTLVRELLEAAARQPPVGGRSPG